MSIEAFTNAQNARRTLTYVLGSLGLSHKNTELIMSHADFYAEATGMLRVNEALEKLNVELKQVK